MTFSGRVHTNEDIYVGCGGSSKLTINSDYFRAVGKIYRIVEILALNVGRAKEGPPNRAGGRFVAEYENGDVLRGTLSSSRAPE